MHKIKICHFVNLITGNTDGVYTHIKMLLTNLDKNKYEQILIFHGGEKVLNKISNLGIKVYTISELNKKFSLLAFIKFFRIVRNENIDIIHTHLLKPYVVGGLCNIFLRRKMIFNYHGLFINNEYYNHIEKYIYYFFHFVINFFHSCDLAIVPSETSKNILLSETKLFPEVSFYYNSFDNCEIKNEVEQNILDFLLKIKKDYLVVGVVARMEIQKRIEIALQILSKLKEENKKIFFVFFGDGPLEEQMKNYANELKVLTNCKFFGYVKNATAYFNYFDVILLTSKWEGLPLTIWEAMYYEVPIISTNVGGVKEIIESNNCGMTYESGDVSGGVQCIIKLYKNKNLRNQMGQNGKKALNEKYNLQQFVNYFEQLYDKLIN